MVVKAMVRPQVGMIFMSQYEEKAAMKACKTVSYDEAESGRNAYANGDVNILRKNDALELNHEEVDQLLEVLKEALEGFLRDGEVAARSDLAGKALAHDSLACNLGKSGGCTTLVLPSRRYLFPLTAQDDVCALQEIAEDIEVASSEDEGNDAEVGDQGRARILPL